MPKLTIVVISLFAVAFPAFCQDSVQETERDRGSLLVHHLSDRDIWLTISSVEWGTPGRWSITSRFIHAFEDDRDDMRRLNNLSITLSPGIAGGRAGIGYLGVFSSRSKKGISVIGEARAVLLRTWGKPRIAVTNATFVGGELRLSLTGLVNAGIGYFRQVSGTENISDDFVGWHVGVGI